MKVHHGLLIVGIILMAVPFVVAMSGLRQMLGTLRNTGIGDPSSLFSGLSEVLAGVGFGWLFLPLGVGVVAFSLYCLSHQKRIGYAH